MLAYDAFTAAISAARGLSREQIDELQADCLSGQAAVDAGLADGVASLDEVTRLALALASGEESGMATEKADTTYEKTTKESYTETDPKDPADMEEDEGKEGEEAKAEDEGEEEEAPPSSKPMPPAAKNGAKASLASLAGLPVGASDIAIRTNLTRRMAVFSHASKLVGSENPDTIMGAIDSLARDAAEAGRLRTERNDALKRANAAERKELLTKLIDAGVHTRGELFTDVVEGGKVVGMRPAKLWGPGKEGRTLDNLRGYVKQQLAGAAPKPKASPFEPDEKIKGGAFVTSSDKKLAEKNGYDPERVAAARQGLFGGAAAQGVNR